MLTVIEGIDALGKSTLIRNLKEIYPEAAYTFEPGSYWCLHEISENANAYEELLLFMTDRLEHNLKMLMPYSQTDRLVICDRYMLSNIMYQGYYLAKENSANSYYEPTDADPYQKLIYDMHIPEYFVHPDLTIILYTNWDVENEVKERIRKECDDDEDLYNDLGYINDDYMRSSYAYVKNKLVHICVDGRTPEEMCELVKREIDEVMKNDR